MCGYVAPFTFSPYLCFLCVWFASTCLFAFIVCVSLCVYACAFLPLCLHVCASCAPCPHNLRPPVLPGHEPGAGERDPDVPLAVHGVQDLHRVPAASPRGRDDVLRQVRPRLPHVLRGHGLHTYRWGPIHPPSHLLCTLSLCSSCTYDFICDL